MLEMEPFLSIASGLELAYFHYKICHKKIYYHSKLLILWSYPSSVLYTEVVDGQILHYVPVTVYMTRSDVFV